MRAGTLYNMRPYKIAKLFNELNRTSLGIENLEIITLADDMLKRDNTTFSTLARNTLNSVNGKTLKQEGITVENMGIDKFLSILYTKQSEYIKKHRQ